MTLVHVRVPLINPQYTNGNMSENASMYIINQDVILFNWDLVDFRYWIILVG